VARRTTLEKLAGAPVDDLLRQMRIFAEQIAPRFADAG
jgi:hypothetical protein